MDASARVSRGDARERLLCLDCLGKWVESTAAETQPGSERATKMRDAMDAAARAAELAERKLLDDPEKSRTPRELALMGEWYISWYERIRQEPPARIRHFIAKYAKDAPPLAAPVAGAVASESDLRKARLALMRLVSGEEYRSANPKQGLRIDPNPASVSIEEAADMLGRMPKPVRCTARLDKGSITVRCRRAEDHVVPNHSSHSEEFTHRSNEHILKEYGPPGDPRRAQLLLCVARDESVLLSVDEVADSERDYITPFCSMSGSSTAWYLSCLPEIARQAYAAGAVSIRDYGVDDSRWKRKEEGRIIQVLEGGGYDAPLVYVESIDSLGDCEVCKKRAGFWRSTDSRQKPWLERVMCATCVENELTPLTLGSVSAFVAWYEGLSEKGKESTRARLPEFCERHEEWWQRLSVPPEVAAAIARLRALS